MSGKQQPISLYFHVPFCKKKCDYCHFYVIPDNETFKQQYMEALKLEWNRWVPEIRDKKICSIYFGGGTPSLLGPKYIEQIFSWFQDIGISPTNENIEITLEANPEDISLSKMQSYAAIGINRVSIGVQSFDDLLLQKLTRQHNSQKAIDAVLITEKSGISNISIDLMYDLPYQTLESWEKSLIQTTELPVQHVSLYNLVFEKHTVFFKKQDTLAPHLPDPEISTKMYESAIHAFENAGFNQYEISAFQKHDSYSRHNIGYWQARPFIGMGPSAFSYWKERRFRNHANLSRYRSALKQNISPIDFEEELSPAAKIREILAIHLRLLDGVNRKQFETSFGKLDEETNQILDKLTQQGFLNLSSNNDFSLTKKGILFYDSVATEIIL